MARLHLRPMTAADITPATDLIVRGDWGDRRQWFEFATTQYECHPIVAEIDGDIVGTGVGSANGRVGWVGTIYVAPEVRGKGLGRSLTQAVIADLEAAGCRTLVLVSTEQGLSLYESMGFEIQTHYRILEAHGLAGLSSTAALDAEAVRPLRSADLPGMESLDAAATGEDRGHLVRRFADPSSAKVLSGADGSIRAFVVRAPWGGGATIARDPDAAMGILRARQVAAGPDRRIRVGLLEENTAGLAALEEAGLTPIWSAPRLTRGEPLAWRPEWIWGQFNHAIG
jgi:ribosomal protein S18 acetylase RimI-like enzyme